MVDKIHTPRFNMSEKKLYLRNPVQPDTGRCIDIPSVDQCQKFVRQIGSNIDDIINDVMKANTMNIYPLNQKTDGICDILKLRIEEVKGPGLAYIWKYPSLICGIKTKVRPQIVCDACVFVDNFPPLILTVVKHENYYDESVKQYNLQIAREIIDEMRSYIAEPFSAIYGIMSDTKLETKESFMTSLEDIKKKTSRLCVPTSLQVTPIKLKCIIRAFITVTALSNQILDDNSWWVLTREQYSILTENIEKRDVKVQTSPGSGGKVLLREVARRLETVGCTLLVLETEEQCQEARIFKPCSNIMTQKEFLPYLKEKKRPVEEVTNLVTNCNNCPHPDWISGVMWTIILENEDNVFLQQEDKGFLQQEDKGFLQQEDKGFLQQEDKSFLQLEDKGFLQQEDKGFLQQEDKGFLSQGNENKDVLVNPSELGNLIDNITHNIIKAFKPLHENMEETVNQLRQEVNSNSTCMAELKKEMTTLRKALKSGSDRDSWMRQSSGRQTSGYRVTSKDSGRSSLFSNVSEEDSSSRAYIPSILEVDSDSTEEMTEKRQDFNTMPHSLPIDPSSKDDTLESDSSLLETQSPFSSCDSDEVLCESDAPTSYPETSQMNRSKSESTLLKKTTGVKNIFKKIWTKKPRTRSAEKKQSEDWLERQCPPEETVV